MGFMSFTAHVHPKVPQNDKIFFYGVKHVLGGAGRATGCGVIVHHKHSSRKIDMIHIVPGKFFSFHIFLHSSSTLSVVTSIHDIYFPTIFLSIYP